MKKALSRLLFPVLALGLLAGSPLGGCGKKAGGGKAVTKLQVKYFQQGTELVIQVETNPGAAVAWRLHKDNEDVNKDLLGKKPEVAVGGKIELRTPSVSRGRYNLWVYAHFPGTTRGGKSSDFPVEIVDGEDLFPKVSPKREDGYQGAVAACRAVVTVDGKEVYAKGADYFGNFAFDAEGRVLVKVTWALGKEVRQGDRAVVFQKAGYSQEAVLPLDVRAALGAADLSKLTGKGEMVFPFVIVDPGDRQIQAGLHCGLSILSGLMAPAEQGKPVKFDGDADAPASPRNVMWIWGSDVRLFGTAARLVDLDLVAFVSLDEKRVGTCDYKGEKMSKTIERVANHKRVTVVDRRTGKVVRKDRLTADDPPPCPASILSTSDYNPTGFVSDAAIEKWAAGLLGK